MVDRLGDRLLERGRRLVRGPAGVAPGAGRDRFAEYRDIAGPRLVGGPTPRRSARLDGTSRVVVLMPHLSVSRMSGGPNTIFQVTARLATQGIPLRYVATFGPLDDDERRLREHIRVVTGVKADEGSIELVDASADGAALDVGVNDVLVASWWPTAHIANAALAHVRADAFVYLIQDFEPGFYPWSTKYALAEATYVMPIRAVVNESTLLEHLRTAPRGGLAAGTPTVSFTPAVDRRVFAPRPAVTGRAADSARRLAFYARPKNPRNLFDLGLLALRTAVARGVFQVGEWEFAAIGQEVPDLQLTDRHTLHAVPWLDYEAYGRFLRETDILLSLMLSPHTSYPPLEMAATGGRVVTNTFGTKTADALRAFSPAIHGVEPTVDTLVDALAEAVHSVGAAPDRSDGGGGESSALPASWDEALAHVTPWLAETVDALRSGR
jgi:hypothetical protein